MTTLKESVLRYNASDWPCIIILTCMAYASLL